MELIETRLPGAYMIKLSPIQDERGYFARSFCTKEFSAKGLDHRIVQCNVSYTKYKYTLRGMHFQQNGWEEVKIVRCTKGAIMDVIIDLRHDSKTFCQHYSIELRGCGHEMIYVPKGFAHGFITLSDDVEVTYMVTQSYSRENERGILWNDPLFGIEWPTSNPILSEKDAKHPLFNPAINER